MAYQDIYYVLYPQEYETKEKGIIHGIDYDKLVGYAFRHVWTSPGTNTMYFRSVYPDTATMLTIDKAYFESGRSGLHTAMSKEIGCVVQKIDDKCTGTLPECSWYGDCDGTCFLHGAGCSPMYRQYGAYNKWGIPLDEERKDGKTDQKD